MQCFMFQVIALEGQAWREQGVLAAAAVAAAALSLPVQPEWELEAMEETEDTEDPQVLELETLCSQPNFHFFNFLMPVVLLTTISTLYISSSCLVFTQHRHMPPKIPATPRK